MSRVVFAGGGLDCDITDCEELELLTAGKLADEPPDDALYVTTDGDAAGCEAGVIVWAVVEVVDAGPPGDPGATVFEVVELVLEPLTMGLYTNRKKAATAIMATPTKTLRTLDNSAPRVEGMGRRAQFWLMSGQMPQSWASSAPATGRPPLDGRPAHCVVTRGF